LVWSGRDFYGNRKHMLGCNWAWLLPCVQQSAGLETSYRIPLISWLSSTKQCPQQGQKELHLICLVFKWRNHWLSSWLMLLPPNSRALICNPGLHCQHTLLVCLSVVVSSLLWNNSTQENWSRQWKLSGYFRWEVWKQLKLFGQLLSPFYSTCITAQTSETTRKAFMHPGLCFIWKNVGVWLFTPKYHPQSLFPKDNSIMPKCSKY